jgi:uncharacterized protein DUF3373
MHKFIRIIVALTLFAGFALLAQESGQQPQSANNDQAASAGPDSGQLRQQIEELKQTIAVMEKRLDAQEKAQAAATQNSSDAQKKEEASPVADLQADVKDLGERVSAAERKGLLDRLSWSGDYRFQAHTIRGDVPAHFDGMMMQNLVVRTLFYAQTNGGAFPPNVTAINNNVAANYSQYLYFTNNLTFSDLKAAMGQFPPAMQQQLFGMLMPSTFVGRYSNNTNILQTNRLRLKFDAQVADNVSVTARLSMYKVFGDSTGVQVFNGQPNTLNIDGTTAGVPNGDMIRVERVYFNWNNIGGSKFYLSIGRRPSTEGPPWNFRQDEPRGGTPSGSLIDYQFDGITFGYHVNEKVALRACYGQGFSSGFGNGNLLKTPADRLKDVHFFGGNFDLYSTDKTFIQSTIARAWDVTDGFNGLVVLPNNPLTGEAVQAPVVMRFTPSANLGAINLYGLNVQRTLRQFDLYVSGNWVSLRPNGQTTPFGGLMSDPFEAPQNHEGHMVYAGVRYSIPQNDGRTKIGFEFNQGSKYWFNFAQAEDDIFAPKSNTRGEAYETYLTHRINDHFIFKADFMHYNYTWSGSGWHLGAPKRLNSTPLLGFPTYDSANMFTAGLTTRF